MHIITWKAKLVIVCLHSVWTTAKIVKTPNFNFFYFNQACGFFVTIVSGEILSHPACSKVNINTADSRVFVNNSTIYVMQGFMPTLWSLQIKRHGYRSVCVTERQQDDAINSQGTVLIFFSKPWILSMYCYLLYNVH